MGDSSFTVTAYRQHLADRKLMGSKCRGCGSVYLPPRPICSACHDRNMEWSELAGEGKVVGLTSIAIVPAAMAAKGFGRDRPYLTGVVALREGPSLAARLAVADGAGLEVGAPVRADFVEEGEGEDHSVTLVFRPE